MAEPLRLILYRSYSALTGGAGEVEAELASILAVSRRNNERDGVTGGLLHASDAFIQVLEGPGDRVEATFERICCDQRHRRVQLLEMTEINERVFEGFPLALIQDGQPFQALIPFISASGEPSLKQEAARSAVQLMRACLREGAQPPEWNVLPKPSSTTP